MANFQVPQFIDEKAKIIGPLSIGQFLYLAGGGLAIFLAFKVFTFLPSLLIAAVIGPLSAALAFIKINGQEFPKVALSALSYTWKPRTYTWQRPVQETEFTLPDLERIQALRRDMSIQEKLQDLALRVVTGKIFKEEGGRPGAERYQTVTYLTGEKGLAKRVDY